MKVPIQAKPVLRVIGETVKPNYEDAVKAAENQGSCYSLKKCQGSAWFAPNTFDECKKGGGKSWSSSETGCINT